MDASHVGRRCNGAENSDVNRVGTGAWPSFARFRIGLSTGKSSDVAKMVRQRRTAFPVARGTAPSPATSPGRARLPASRDRLRKKTSRTLRITASGRRVLKNSIAQRLRSQSRKSTRAGARCRRRVPAGGFTGISSRYGPARPHSRESRPPEPGSATGGPGRANGDQGMAVVQLLVGEPAVLPARPPAPPAHRRRAATSSVAAPRGRSTLRLAVRSRAVSAVRYTQSAVAWARVSCRVIRATKSAVLWAMPSIRQGSNTAGWTSRICSRPKFFASRTARGDVHDVLGTDEDENRRW